MVSLNDFQDHKGAGMLREKSVSILASRNTVYLILALLLVYVMARGIVGARAKLLWFDEIQTLVISNRPSVPLIWNTLARGFDVHPPTFYLLERFIAKFISAREIGLRLPSILSFIVILICVFIYARRETDDRIALLAVLLLMPSSRRAKRTIRCSVCSVVANSALVSVYCVEENRLGEPTPLEPFREHLSPSTC